MALRIFYGLVVLIALYLSFGIYQVKTQHKSINKADAAFVMGPKDADVTIVEFLDYACPYCREIHPTIIQAVKQDGHVRYIPRPLPSKNKDSVNAFIIAHKAAQYDKFFEMHDQLMSDFKPIDEDVLIEMSSAIGLTLGDINTEIDTDAIQDQLKENWMLFRAFGGQATPLFVLNGKMTYVPEGSMPTVNDFLTMFEQARAAP